MAQPTDIAIAKAVDTLAQRYGQLPTTILESDAQNLRIAEIAVLMEAQS